jgi:DNA-directed RNA polymerase specialized sigma24 family protein
MGMDHTLSKSTEAGAFNRCYHRRRKRIRVHTDFVSALFKPVALSALRLSNTLVANLQRAATLDAIGKISLVATVTATLAMDDGAQGRYAPKLTEPECDEVVTGFLQGDTKQALADHLGVSLSTVKRLLRRRKVRRQPNRQNT